MKYIWIFVLLFGVTTTSMAKDGFPDGDIPEYMEEPKQEKPKTIIQSVDSVVSITVVGQGVAPSFATSPAQAYVLAKKAATADAYRLIAEQVKGVKIEGKDTIKNMAISSSYINTQVNSMIRNAKIVETTFKDGLCEVEMEIKVDQNKFK